MSLNHLTEVSKGKRSKLKIGCIELNCDDGTFGSVNINSELELLKVASVGNSTPGTVRMYANSSDGLIHTVDENNVDAPLGGSMFDQDSVAIGYNAGENNQDIYAVAVGKYAGEVGQGASSVAVGYKAGRTSQSNVCVAIGFQAGETSQGINSVAIGSSAANDTQGDNSIAIGKEAGQTSQGVNAIAIGNNAGSSNQPDGTIAIGQNAVADALQTLAFGSGTKILLNTPVPGTIDLPRAVTMLPVSIAGVNYQLALFDAAPPL